MRLQTMTQVEPRTLAVVTSIALAAVACAPDQSGSDSATVMEQAGPATVQPLNQTRCFRSPHSVLLGPDVGLRNAGYPPGWVRLDSFVAGPSGPAQLLDANGAQLAGQWHHQAGDSLRIRAADDFLRTELDVTVTEDSLRGRGAAHSDADLERDSAGKLAEVRRKWDLRAVRVSCDSLPRR
jgi:hypothetical protein